MLTETRAALAAQTELGDEGAVALEVVLAQVVEQATTLADEHEQAATAVVILLVLPKVLGQIVDARRQQGDLDPGAPGVLGVLPELGDDLLLAVSGQRAHVRREKVAGRRRACPAGSLTRRRGCAPRRRRGPSARRGRRRCRSGARRAAGA